MRLGLWSHFTGCLWDIWKKNKNTSQSCKIADRVTTVAPRMLRHRSDIVNTLYPPPSAAKNQPLAVDEVTAILHLETDGQKSLYNTTNLTGIWLIEGQVQGVFLTHWALKQVDPQHHGSLLLLCIHYASLPGSITSCKGWLGVDTARLIALESLLKALSWCRDRGLSDMCDSWGKHVAKWEETGRMAWPTSIRATLLSLHKSHRYCSAMFVGKYSAGINIPITRKLDGQIMGRCLWNDMNADPCKHSTIPSLHVRFFCTLDLQCIIDLLILINNTTMQLKTGGSRAYLL